MEIKDKFCLRTYSEETENWHSDHAHVSESLLQGGQLQSGQLQSGQLRPRCPADIITLAGTETQSVQ